MKILRYQPEDDSPKTFTLQFSFDAETGVLSGTVGMTRNSSDLIRDFSVDLNLWKGKVLDATLMTTDKGYEVVIYNAFQNYAMGNGMPECSKNHRWAIQKLFRVVVHENLDDSLIQVRQGHDEIEGFENILETGDIRLTAYNLAQHDELAAEIIAKARRKSDLLGKIDQRDSVSYLEAQVDILTRLYLQDHPEAAGELVQLLKKADSHSILDIKNTDRIQEEFDEKKALVRTAQQEYYAENIKALAS